MIALDSSAWSRDFMSQVWSHSFKCVTKLSSVAKQYIKLCFSIYTESNCCMGHGPYLATSVDLLCIVLQIFKSLASRAPRACKRTGGMALIVCAFVQGFMGSVYHSPSLTLQKSEILDSWIADQSALTAQLWDSSNTLVSVCNNNTGAVLNKLWTMSTIITSARPLLTSLEGERWSGLIDYVYHCQTSITFLCYINLH